MRKLNEIDLHYCIPDRGDCVSRLINYKKNNFRYIYTTQLNNSQKKSKLPVTPGALTVISTLIKPLLCKCVDLKPHGV